MPLQGLWWLPEESSISEQGPMDLDRHDHGARTTSPKSDSSRPRNGLRAAASPIFDELRLEVFDEGRAAQIMHIGPYADEAPTIEKLHAFIHDQGHSLRGKHHEIYIGDPNRSAPEKLKTIIRQPIE